MEFEKQDYYFISLDIFDIHGRKIVNLISGPTMSNKLIWHGKNNLDQMVPAGIYFARLETKSTIMTKKMILLK